MTEVTRILSAIEQGDPHAADQLLPLVYDELRRLAATRLAHEARGHTLQPTALVHEAYLRLVAPNPERRFTNRHGTGILWATRARARLAVGSSTPVISNIMVPDFTMATQ